MSDMTRDEFISSLIECGYSSSSAESAADYVEAAGIPFSTARHICERIPVLANIVQEVIDALVQIIGNLADNFAALAAAVREIIAGEDAGSAERSRQGCRARREYRVQERSQRTVWVPVFPRPPPAEKEKPHRAD